MLSQSPTHAFTRGKQKGWVRHHFHFCCCQWWRHEPETLGFAYSNAVWIKQRVKSVCYGPSLCSELHQHKSVKLWVILHLISQRRATFWPVFLRVAIGEIVVPRLMPPPCFKFASICSRFEKHSWPEWQFKSLLVRPDWKGGLARLLLQATQRLPLKAYSVNVISGSSNVERSV